MPPALTITDLLDLLDSGKPMLLPSSRAARELRAAFDARQRALSRAAWEPAPALSWKQWTASVWSALIPAGAETRLLLNHAQEHSLWREIVLEDAAHHTLGSPDSLANLAQSAWALANAYNAIARLPQTAGNVGLHQDSRIFSQWASVFQERCADRGLLSASLLDDALRLHILRGTLPAPASLQLAGFGDQPPAQEAVLRALRQRGTTVAMLKITAIPRAPQLRAAVVAADPREELQFAARWVRSYLESHRESHPRVAILVPNLTEEHAEIDSVLREVLAPELQSIGADLSSAPWETTATMPLASLYSIAAALNLIRWTQGPLPMEQAGALLLSPCLGRAEERDELARFDSTTLRRQTLLRPEMDIAQVLRLLSSHTPQASVPAAWLSDVNALAQRAASLRTTTYAEWMEHVRTLLAAAHWPGANSSTLDATGFETTLAWEGLLDLISTLDFSGRRVPFDVALQTLQLHAESTPFTPPSTHAPVQVMGVAETEGCLFDAVVFLRATDANWPAPEYVHPLLPWSLQSSLAMPGTNAARTTQRARAFTTSLLERSGAVLFTSAAADDHGRLRSAPLLVEFSLSALTPEQICVTPPLQPPIAVETLADDTPLPPLAVRNIKGGGAVLQAQAACGFQAFAKFRLNARDLATTDLGFDAPESGSRLHSALQFFWKEVETQDNLRAMALSDREEALRRSVDQAMLRHLHPRGKWDEAYLALQKRRMVSLLLQWLDLELQRSPFRVRERETNLQVDVGPLTVDVRFDRIDMLENGFAIVDYKTGISGHPRQWKGDRPDDPQLPLYSLLDGADELRALAFAKIRAGEMKWLGYQAESGILPASRTTDIVNLQDEIEEWRTTLAQLAQDFADGRASVNPARYPLTCQRCSQRMLCRLDPATLVPANEAGEETGAELGVFDE